jgi:hypothetical protein
VEEEEKVEEETTEIQTKDKERFFQFLGCCCTFVLKRL